MTPTLHFFANSISGICFAVHLQKRMNTATESNGHSNASSTITNGKKKNNSTRGWIVQKFGGTSVGKLPVNIAEDIVR